MKLWIGFGTTLLIGASSYAFCPPRQSQVATTATTNGVCAVSPTGSVSVLAPAAPRAAGGVMTVDTVSPVAAMMPAGAACATIAPCPPTPSAPPPPPAIPRRAASRMKQHGDARALEMQAAELEALRAEFDAKRASRTSLEATSNGGRSKQAIERSLRAVQQGDAERLKVVTERLNYLGEVMPATREQLDDAKRAIEIAAAQAATADAACAEACAEACEAVCEAACEPACEETCDEACAPSVSSVTTFGTVADVEADGITVMEAGVDTTSPRKRVLALGGGAGGNTITRHTYPRARAAVRGTTSRIAPDTYEYKVATGTSGHGDHAQILDQLRALTDEVRALRDEVRALRASDRANRTY